MVQPIRDVVRVSHLEQRAKCICSLRLGMCTPEDGVDKVGDAFWFERRP